MGRARALLKSITTSKTGLYYLYGRYPSQILGDPEHKAEGKQARSRQLSVLIFEARVYLTGCLAYFVA